MERREFLASCAAASSGIKAVRKPDDGPLQFWGIVELMGHVKMAGRITEVQIAGSQMLRIEIPTEAGIVTQYFPTGSVYRITPSEEKACRSVAMSGVEPIYCEVQRSIPWREEEEDWR